MAPLNALFLEGNIVRDPELKTFSEDKCVCNYTLAQNQKWKEQDKSLFIDCASWNKCGKFAKEYLHKGSHVILGGRLAMDRWEYEGDKKQKIKFTVNEIHLMGKKERIDEQRDDGLEQPELPREKPAGSPF